MKISETLTTYGLCIENEFLEAYETLINEEVNQDKLAVFVKLVTKKRRKKDEKKTK